MKKKLFAFLCAICIVFGLTACGEKEYNEVETQKLAQCEEVASYLLQIAMTAGNAENVAELNEYFKKVDMELLLENYTYSMIGMPIKSDYGVFNGMLTTYAQAVEDMGGLISTGDCTSEIVGDDIIVTYDLIGTNANGTFTFSFDNKYFELKLNGAEAKAKLSIKQNLQKAGKNMGNAGLNTLLGMGTVFSVLILISLIISGFGLINGGTKKKKPAEVKAVETTTEVIEEELSDDTELVAVIAAAIAAYEGQTSTDGFVVRSIRRANRRN